MRAISFLTSAFCLVLLSETKARTQPVSLQPFTITGATNVVISGINDSGVAVGTYSTAKSSAQYGFVGRSGRVSSLPSLLTIAGHPCMPMPTSINNLGAVAGIYLAEMTHGFVWQGGKYINDFLLGNQPGNLPPPVIGSANRVGYNYYAGSGVTYIYAGKLPAPSRVNVGNFAVLNSLNSQGEVAGQFQSLFGRTATPAVFLAKPSEIDSLLPPGARASFGGFLNEQGQVAGSFIDQDGKPKGFIYHAGSYQIMETPPNTTELSVQGVDSTGTMIGLYSDTLAQHAFIYRSGKMTTFGSWATDDNVVEALSPLGAWLAVTVRSNAMNTIQSFIGQCSC